jgi:hypothetical protein
MLDWNGRRTGLQHGHRMQRVLNLIAAKKHQQQLRLMLHHPVPRLGNVIRKCVHVVVPDPQILQA